jgi:hypothetical protein
MQRSSPVTTLHLGLSSACFSKGAFRRNRKEGIEQGIKHLYSRQAGLGQLDRRDSPSFHLDGAFIKREVENVVRNSRCAVLKVKGVFARIGSAAPRRRPDAPAPILERKVRREQVVVNMARFTCRKASEALLDRRWFAMPASTESALSEG